MYAIIKTGGKQYRVAEGDRFKVETLAANEGDDYQFDDVLMIVDGGNATIGTPTVDGAAVTATIVSHGRHKKVEIIKFRRRKHHQKRTGHRQNYTEIKITSIAASGATKQTAESNKTEATQTSTETASAAQSPFLSAPNGDADDLKQFKGVGPALEKKLNAAGIYHYAQIAAYTAEDLEIVNAEIKFKEEWVEEAKALAEK